MSMSMQTPLVPKTQIFRTGMSNSNYLAGHKSNNCQRGKKSAQKSLGGHISQNLVIENEQVCVLQHL